MMMGRTHLSPHLAHAVVACQCVALIPLARHQPHCHLTPAEHHAQCMKVIIWVRSLPTHGFGDVHILSAFLDRVDCTPMLSKSAANNLRLGSHHDGGRAHLSREVVARWWCVLVQRVGQVQQQEQGE